MSNYKPTRRERGEQASQQARNAPANPVPSAANSNATPEERRHFKLGWWSLFTFVCLGITLEGMLAFRVGWYMDVGDNETHRLMLRLGHAHGALLSVLNIVELSITAQRLTEELEKAFALWDGPSLVLRMDNGPEFILQVLQQFCRGRVGICYIPPGTPRNNGHIESFNNRLRKECLNRNYWTSLLEAKVVIEDFKDDHNHRHRHSSLSYLTPSWGCLPLAGAYAARWLPHPPTGGWLRDRLTSIRTGFRTMWSDYRGPAKTSTTRPRGTGYSGVTTYASPTRLRMPHTSPDLSIVARRQRPDQSGTSACQKRPGCAPT